MWQEMIQHHKITCLQLSHLARAQNLFKRIQPGHKYPLKHFICGCENSSLCGELLFSGILQLSLSERQNSRKPDSLSRKDLSDKVEEKKAVVKGHNPIPLSALLYQCLFNGSLTPGDFLRLFREAVADLNPSEKCTRMMVVWPKYLEKSKENWNSSQTNYGLPMSPNPVELQKEDPGLELLQYDRMVHMSPALVFSGSTSPDHMDSSICSPAAPHAEGRQEETNDEDCDLPRDSHMSCKDVTQCTSHITITGDIQKSMLIKSFYNQSIDHLVISEEKEMIQEPHSERVSAEDENEQMSVLSSESERCQDAMFEEAFRSSTFLNLKPLRRALPHLLVEKNVRANCYEDQDVMEQPEILTSCAHAEAMQDLLEQFSEQSLSMKDEELGHPSFLPSVRSSIQGAVLNPVRRGSRSHQFQISLGAPLLPLSHAEKTKDKAASEGKTERVKEVVCFRTTSERMGDCKLGSWWKQALETRRASTGLLPAVEQVPAVTKEKRHSLVLGWPQCHGLIRACKQDVKLATKEESSSRKAKGKKGNRSNNAKSKRTGTSEDSIL